MSTQLARGGASTVTVEFVVEAGDYAVLDGYLKGSGRTKTDVLREILKEWSQKKHRESIYVVRVAGDNPDAPGLVPPLSGDDPR